MPSVIFSGSYVKTLKDALRLGENAKIISGSSDPSITPIDGNPGDAYISTLTKNLYIKQDSGSSTAWSKSSTLISFTHGSIPYADLSGNLTEDNSNLAYDDVTKTLTVTNLTVTGTQTTIDTVDLDVKDKLVTLNKGGAAASATGTGLQFEENSSITGYVKTSADRNSLTIKAPNTAGIATITPGVSGITLDQSSHDPITLTTVGSSPNSNAASLSSQALTLQPADGTNPGVLTAGSQSIGGNKTFTGTISASNFSGSSSGTNTGDVTLAAVGSSPNANAATLSGQQLNLQPADGSNPGVVSTTTQTFAGNKTFTGTISASNLSGTNSGDITLTAVGATPNSNAASLSGQALTLQPADGTNPGIITSGTQTIGGNKTFSGTATVAQLIDNGLTASTAVYADGSKQLASSATTATELGYVSGVTSSIQTQLNGKLSASTGDVNETSVALAQTQTNTTLFTLNSNARSAKVIVSTTVIATSSLYAEYSFDIIQKNGSYEMSQEYTGDDTLVTFNITSGGIIQYSSGTYSGFDSVNSKFKYRVYSTTI